MERARQVLKDHIRSKTTPGATAVVVVGDRIGQTFAEGRHTYDPDSPAVRVDDRYDLASLTKLVTTTACLLLEEERRISLDDPVSEWVPDFDRDGRGSVTLRHLLAHCSGLPAHRPLYETCRTPDDALEAVCRTPLESTPGTMTTYSDLGFILLGAVLERASGMAMDSLVGERVLDPMGMRQTGYRPAADLLSRIPPTEADGEEPIHGVVHDDNTRAIGGVAPHAGLFGPATDVARLVMAYLNDGRLDGEQVLPEDGVRGYVARANLVEASTRALGWDTVSESGSSAGQYFSLRSFGHLGFTGTSVWADPEQKLGVILLTNRVHSTYNNDGIRRLRPEFHDAIREGL